ncbi:hypothetical protein [Lysobacter sp. Root690]|uniref:hypothetical protein n=1 Tax=Lysobacter sp. Root690 TaxID=1736588 RepID=UPI0006FBBB42|nr:hypothetical protein [Lysobacter sp. Root690]KRB02279.1 hypothetical protein ASD86_22200 [Lysobacter sp. Root690]
MSFVLYALLGEDSPLTSIERIDTELGRCFALETDLVAQFEVLPFTTERSLRLRWPNWAILVFYEDGPSVLADSREIQRIAGTPDIPDLSGIGRRVRVVFGSDDDRVYTNHVIWMMEYLCGIEGAFVFDPLRKEFISLT